MENYKEYENFDIGDYIEAVAIEPISDIKNSWLGYSKQISPKWKLELISTSNLAIVQGEFNKYRIIKISNNCIVAYNSINYCSKKITDNEKINKLINNFKEIVENNIETTNKKYMIKTCLNILNLYRNSWTLKGISRFEYYIGLGEPSFSEYKLIKNIIFTICDDLKNKSPNYILIKNKLQELINNNVLFRLEFFYKYLTTDKKILTKPQYGKLHKKNVLDKAQVKRIISRQEIKKTEWASCTHQKTLELLMQKLKYYNYNPEEGLFIDCFAYIKSGPAIFEIKSITDFNELSQIRAAISQLYEYRFRHNYPQASLWIVLSRKPEIEWILKYLLEDRHINVLWIENNILVGPSLKEL